MKYVIRATKNPCGGVEGLANMGRGTELQNWTTTKEPKPYRGMELNEAYKLFEYYQSHNKRNCDNCGCVFDIEEWSIP